MQNKKAVVSRNRTKSEATYSGKKCDGNSTDVVPWSLVCTGKIAKQFIAFQMDFIFSDNFLTYQSFS